jgi:predicted secreted protein
LGSVSSSGTTRTATFTPTPGYNGNASLTVQAAGYSDAAGNVGSAGNTSVIAVDTVAPTLAITSSSAALRSGQTATITFSFSEDPVSSFVWDGTAGDIAVTGGTLGAISGSGLTRTATFTPTPGFEGHASITVLGTDYQDLAGNDGTAAATPLIAIDTLAPTVAITSSSAAVRSGQTAVLTFTFSEDPVGFSWDGTAGDIAVTGGTLGAISGTGPIRQAVFTPTEGQASGNASITVASGTYTDAAGNPGGAGTLTDSGGNSISIVSAIVLASDHKYTETECGGIGVFVVRNGCLLRNQLHRERDQLHGGDIHRGGQPHVLGQRRS